MLKENALNIYKAEQFLGSKAWNFYIGKKISKIGSIPTCFNIKSYLNSDNWKLSRAEGIINNVYKSNFQDGIKKLLASVKYSLKKLNV